MARKQRTSGRVASVINLLASMFERLFSPYFMAFVCGCLAALTGLMIYSALGGA